jgi:2-iminoacetate synthase ThiH
MRIQSLSIVVPSKSCINDCKFCVSKMHTGEQYEDMISGKNLYFNLYMKDYVERMQFARDNGCNTVMLTGDCEPQQNWKFLQLFGIFNQMLKNPFKNIEIQTTGVLIDDDYLYFLRHHVRVNTISMSVSNMFDDEINCDINGTDKTKTVNIKHLCSRIKKYRFNLRMSLNMTSHYNTVDPEKYFSFAHELGANQITFRVLYESDKNTPQDIWITENKFDETKVKELNSYIKSEGRPLEITEFGHKRYSVHGLSTILDDDCMSQEPKESLKYLILRPDCKLYSKWDDDSSLVF